MEDEKVKEIEERYANPDYVADLMTTGEVEGDIKYLLSRVKELEETLEGCHNWNNQILLGREELKKRIQELKEGIEKHKDDNPFYGIVRDERLYLLIKD